MLTGDNRSKIDKIWDAFWSGGISDPLRVIEQISFLLFIKRLDDIHTGKEKKANRLGKPIEEPIFGAGQDHLRWSRFREFEAEEMFRVVSQEVFPFIKNLHGGLDIPPLSEQNKFHAAVKRIKNLASMNASYLRESETVFNSLLQRSFM